MTPRQAIDHFERQVAALGRLPDRLPLLTYDSASDLSCGKETATKEDLIQQKKVIVALTEHVRARGCVVIHVKFDREAYLAWLKFRPDNRGLRAMWAAEQVRL